MIEGGDGFVDAIFYVRLSSPTSLYVQVKYATVDDVAEASADYEALDNSMTFRPGTVRGKVVVRVHGDSEVEVGERFLVQLREPRYAHLDDAEAIGYILDDDDCPGENLFTNASAEELPYTDPPGWTTVAGNDWEAGYGNSSPDGTHYLNPRSCRCSATPIRSLTRGSFSPSPRRRRCRSATSGPM